MARFRKAQTEMIGLVILVVIIVIGVLFYVKFGLMGNTPKVDTSLDLQRAIFFSTAISRVDICDSTSLQDAIAYCDISGRACGDDACAYLKKNIPLIIKDSLGGEFELANAKSVSSKRFAFYVTKSGSDEKLISLGVECKGKKIVGPYTTPKSDISGERYTINYVIFVCL